MVWHPTPHNGTGLIGDVRSFMVDGVTWRAFEFVSPSDGNECLVLVGPQTHYRATPIPPRWRFMSEEALLDWVLTARRSPGD
jgi:hypothetical protein